MAKDPIKLSYQTPVERRSVIYSNLVGGFGALAFMAGWLCLAVGIAGVIHWNTGLSFISDHQSSRDAWAAIGFGIVCIYFGYRGSWKTIGRGRSPRDEDV